MNRWAIFKCPSGARPFASKVPSILNHYTETACCYLPPADGHLRKASEKVTRLPNLCRSPILTPNS